MLTPSVMMLVAPLLAKTWCLRFTPGNSGDRYKPLLFSFFSSSFVSVVFCFGLGFLLERWRFGDDRDSVRGIWYGCFILLTNGFVSFGGCAVGYGMLSK